MRTCREPDNFTYLITGGADMGCSISPAATCTRLMTARSTVRRQASYQVQIQVTDDGDAEPLATTETLTVLRQ